MKDHVVQLSGVAEVELLGVGGVPEDVALVALEVEVGDRQAVVLVDPDGDDRLARRAPSRIEGVSISICLLTIPWIATVPAERPRTEGTTANR